MGKSTAGSLLAELGVSVIDTDLIAREVVEPGQPALGEIRAQFGPDVLGKDGRLQRHVLARRVFSDRDALKRLESILHPRIREVWLAQVAAWRQEGRAAGAVAIPLLFETDAAGHFDRTVCVACSSATQVIRLRARGWTEPQIHQRIQAQWPVEKKIQASEFVVWTEGSLEAHREQWRLILRETL
jgi:dephospho-CoA kinase